MADRPTVSVIVPAYQAQQTIRAAVASTRGSGVSTNEVEIVVASDDGCDYHSVLSDFENIRYVEPGPVGSGPGPTRNRAIAESRGRYVAFLDADDRWEKGYLSNVLPLAAESGAAFGRSSVVCDEREIIRFGTGQTLSLKEFGQWGASFHPVAQRDLIGQFSKLRSQDTFHTVEILGLLGGVAPLAQAAFVINLRSSSTTRAQGFAKALETDYRAYRSQILNGQSRVPASLVTQAAQVFSDRIALNKRYMKDAGNLSFYEFLDRLAKTTDKRRAA